MYHCVEVQVTGRSWAGFHICSFNNTRVMVNDRLRLCKFHLGVAMHRLTSFA